MKVRTSRKGQDKRLKAKDRRLRTLYRISLDEQNKIEEFQRSHPIYRVLLGKNLGTDHNHKTGQIRGRLDWLINRAYGLMEKSCPDNLAEVLRALAVYHENPPAELALGEKRYGLIGLAKYKKKMVYGPPEAPKNKHGKQ